MKDSKQSPESKPWEFKKGKSGNPGGLTEAERKARDLMRTELSSPEMLNAWRAGYLAQLMLQNPVILKDFADRVGGKPKESLELSQDPNAPVNPYQLLSLEELKAVARAQLEKEKTT